MAELMKKVTAYGQPQNLNEEVLDEAKATLSRFGGDRLKSSIMNLAKQKGLKVKDLGKDKIEISGNGKVVKPLTLAVQKDVKINEAHQTPKQLRCGCIQLLETKMSYLKLKKSKQISEAANKEEVDIQEDGPQMSHLQFVSGL